MSPGRSETVVFLANSPWNFLRQREHELAAGLAEAGYRVRFIEPMPSLAGRLRGMLRPDPASTLSSVPPPNGLACLRPPTCLTFFRSSLIPGVDRLQLLRWLRRAIEREELADCILVYSFAYWEYIGALPRLFGAPRVFFDFSDDERVYARNARALRRMRGASLRLAAGADCLLYSSRGMEDSEVARLARRAVYLPNALRGSLCSVLPASRSAGREREGRIVVGYAGQRSDQIIDVELVRRISESGKWQMRYAGNLGARMRRRLPDVRFEGFIPPERMADFIDSCDVCIIPFARNEVADRVEPLKLYEYCARGKPVVATATPSLAPFAETIYLAESREAFLDLLDRAAREDSPQRAMERTAFAHRNLWGERVRQLASLFKESGGLDG